MIKAVPFAAILDTLPYSHRLLAATRRAIHPNRMRQHEPFVTIGTIIL